MGNRELNPCPFCGSKRGEHGICVKDVEVKVCSDEITFIMECHNCGFLFKRVCKFSTDAVEALNDFESAWNLRAGSKEDALQRRLEAAISDLREADMIDCIHCAHYVSTDRTCANDTGDCLDCNCEYCFCNTCEDLSNWEWRGPQEG